MMLLAFCRNQSGGVIRSWNRTLRECGHADWCVVRMRSYMRGFTLVELLVTVVIILTLASVAFPLAHVMAQRSKETQLREALQKIRSGIDAYKRAADSGHIVLKSGESGYPPSLNVLIEGVADAKAATVNGMATSGTLYFLRRIPRDPMNVDESIPAADTWGKRSYASSYEDPREGVDVFDVYSMSQGIGLNNQPYHQW